MPLSLWPSEAVERLVLPFAFSKRFDALHVLKEPRLSRSITLSACAMLRAMTLSVLMLLNDVTFNYSVRLRDHCVSTLSQRIWDCLGELSKA